ncbi:MAG: HK97 family phage prohead protease, partial [Patescibacteria group bacterium]|nr:HK97 family phage prohead protease [Patescibacteria group bacterium]
EGYAAVFNSDSENFGGWVEQIAPGAFTGVMDDNAFALVNHSMDQVLGRNNVNVKLSQDDIGLKFSIKLPDTTLARDTKELVRSNILNKCSFAFIVQDESFVQGENGAPDKRIINKMAELFDVSIVTVPAYPDTSVASRSFRKSEGMKQIQRSLQEYKLPYLYHKNKLRTNKFKTNARS